MIKFIQKLNKNYIFTKMSYFNGIIMGIVKIILAFLSKSLFLLISSFYNFGIAIAKKTALSNKEQYKRYNLVGIIIIISSLIYMMYSGYIYLVNKSSSYSIYVAIGIAAITFFDLTMAIIGLSKTRKKNDLAYESIKLINLATSLISLSLTQTAILSFAQSKNMARYNAICGMVFSFLALLIGIYMIIYISKRKKV